MKVVISIWIGLLSSPLMALPNAVLGALAEHDSPLNGEDLTDILIAQGAWDGSTPLPGEWEADAGVAETSAAYLMARPKIFGLDALLVRAMHRGDRLEELQITFADAGSFFGYLDRSLPTGVDQKSAIKIMQQRLADRQSEFSEIYQETLTNLTTRLEELDKRPKEIRRGRMRDLRANLNEYQIADRDLVVRKLAAPDRLLRISITRKSNDSRSWLDSAHQDQSERERLAILAKNVSNSKTGDIFIDGIQTVPQGYRPYCGLNTLVMAARYLGLHLDEDWLAVAGKFQNTGSAAGSDMLGLYHSVAKEADFNLKRSNSYDHEMVRKSLRAGMPVIVWRRWNQSRDRLHTKISRNFDRGKAIQYERPEKEFLPSKKKKSPVHASVIIGFNDERKEIIFLESWDENSAPRRMPVAEIDFTTDLLFCFQP